MPTEINYQKRVMDFVKLFDECFNGLNNDYQKDGLSNWIKDNVVKIFDTVVMEMCDVNRNEYLDFIEYKSYLLNDARKINDQYALIQQIYSIPKELSRLM